MSEFEQRPQAQDPGPEHETEGSAAPFMERLVYIFTDPVRVFQGLADTPKWVGAFLVVLLFNIVSTQATYPLIQETQQQQIRARSDLSQEQIEQMEESMAAFSGTTGRLISTGAVTFGTLIVMLVVAGVMMFGCSFILGGEGRFPDVLAVTTHAYLPQAIAGTAVTVPLMLAKGSMFVSTGLNVLLPPDQWQTPLGILLGAVSIFNIWTIALLIIGLSVIYRFSRGKAAWVVIGSYAVYLGLRMLVAQFTSGFMG